MAINARTFQVLYIVRQRAQADEPATMESISEFIHNRRQGLPSIYSRAYISPSAMRLMLQRMTTVESLLALIPGSTEYDLTVKGSQMADLLANIDACSTTFIDNYKDEVCRAVLEQRQRLGQGPVTPREVAALSYISLDSARRGLSALVGASECVEDRANRTPTYALSTPSTQVTDGGDGVTTPGGLDDETEVAAVDKTNPILDVLAGIDETDLEPSADGGPVVPLIDDDIEDNIVPLSLVLGDDGPDTEKEAEEPEGEDEDAVDHYAWDSVGEEVREGHIARAKACGMTLSGYFGMLNRTHERVMREALAGEVPRIVIELPKVG